MRHRFSSSAYSKLSANLSDIRMLFSYVKPLPVGKAGFGVPARLTQWLFFLFPLGPLPWLLLGPVPLPFLLFGPGLPGC